MAKKKAETKEKSTTVEKCIDSMQLDLLKAHDKVSKFKRLDQFDELVGNIISSRTDKLLNRLESEEQREED
jgi:hypothetical protein